MSRSIDVTEVEAFLTMASFSLVENDGLVPVQLQI